MASLQAMPRNRNGILGVSEQVSERILLILIIDRIGSILALAVKLFLRSTIWFAYTQFLWKTLKENYISISGLDAALTVPDSLSALFNWKMIRILKLGAGLALIAW